jgi:aminoglycoside phosphotransferase (APT) family kinase protein
VDGKQVLHGEALTHTDVRSDNLCFLGERVVLIDWNWTCRGNPLADLAFWLPSLEIEGGPAPETILAEGAPFAALISGYLAARAGLPIIPDAPLVRKVQLEQLKSALPWAVRALSLPPLDGRRVVSCQPIADFHTR